MIERREETHHTTSRFHAFSFLISVQSDASALGHGRKRNLRDDPGFAAASGEAFACWQESSEESESYSKVPPTFLVGQFRREVRVDNTNFNATKDYKSQYC